MTMTELRELWDKLIDLLEDGASIYDKEVDHLAADIENELAKLAHKDLVEYP